MNKVYINGILLDGSENMVPHKGKVIFVDGEKISRIEDKKGAKLKGYEIVDLKGKYIMPGLINLHVHMPAGGKPKKKQQDFRKLVKLITSNPISYAAVPMVVKKNAVTELMSGVTTLRAVGGIKNSESKIRDKINAGKILGPRMLVANEAISVPGGHMAGSLAYEATSVEDAIKYAKKIIETKPDLLKLMVTGGVLDAEVRGEPGVLKMAPEMVKAACDVAHANGLKVAAHVESTEGVKVALENGVDTIENFKEDDQFNGNVVFKGIVDCANECLKEGVTVGLGTDTGCPYITHYDMWREIYYFTKYCHVSNAFALHTATQVNAKIIGLEEEIGTIAEGFCADMIVTEDNPLEDIKALRHVDMVITRGRLIQNPKVKKMENVEDALDTLL